jgi:hypothetical protein
MDIVNEFECWKSAVSSLHPEVVRDLDVSNMGRIRKLSGIIYRPHVDKDGYFRISKGYLGKGYGFSVHSLVAETFIGPRPEGMTIDHIDGDKSNNYIDNLQYISNIDNSRKGNSKTRFLVNTTHDERILALEEAVYKLEKMLEGYVSSNSSS